MHRANEVLVKAVVTFVFLVGFAIPVSAQTVTAYEGARLIVGDGRVIENATLVVEARESRRLAAPRTSAYPLVRRV